MRTSKAENSASNHDRILIIDDDRGVGEAIQLLLETEGYQTLFVDDAEKGIKEGTASDYDLVVTDLRLGQASGLDVIRALKGVREDVSIILMTSFSSLESAVEALRCGAVDYIIKPFNNDDFLYSVQRALKEKKTKRENVLLKRSLKKVYAGTKILGQSNGIKKVLALIGRIAPSSASVLIQGESGTGKELVAQAIHFESLNHEGPFVPVNCGAIPADLIESELFGHTKGAYTGATSETEGLVREANGGTLFLDEIAELPMHLQVKLLRVLQDREVRPVGGKQSYRVNMRVVAASNKDLKKLMEKGEFRDDLFYRLNVININVPPLRERDKDIDILARYFIDHYSSKMSKRIRGTSKDFSEFLYSYHWPGNVRELQNLIERAVILTDSEILTCGDMLDVVPTVSVPPSQRHESENRGPGVQDSTLSIEEYIRQVVSRYQDTHSEIEIAQMLGIGRKALWIRRRRWGLSRSKVADNEHAA